MTLCKKKYKNTISEDDKILFKTCTESTEYLHIYFKELKEHLFRHKKYEELFNFCYNTLRNIKNPALSRTTALKVISIALILNPQNADMTINGDILTYAYKLLKRNEEGTNKKFFLYFGHSTNKEKGSLVAESKNLFKTIEIIKSRYHLKDESFINRIYNKIQKKKIHIPDRCSLSYSTLLNDFKNAKKNLFELLETEFVNHSKVDKVYSNYIKYLNDVKGRTIEFLENGEYDFYCKFIDEMQEEEEINIRYESYLLSNPITFNEKKEEKETNQGSTPIQREDLKKSLDNIFLNNQIICEETKEKSDNMNMNLNNDSGTLNDGSFSLPSGSNNKKKFREKKNEYKSLSKNSSSNVTKTVASIVRNTSSNKEVSTEVDLMNKKKIHPITNDESMKRAENELFKGNNILYNEGCIKGRIEEKSLDFQTSDLPLGRNDKKVITTTMNAISGDIYNEKQKQKKKLKKIEKIEKIENQMDLTKTEEDNKKKEHVSIQEENNSWSNQKLDNINKQACNKTVAFDLVGKEKDAREVNLSVEGKTEKTIGSNDSFNEMEIEIINEFNSYLNEGMSQVNKNQNEYKNTFKEFNNSVNDGNNALWNSLIKKSNFYSIKEDFLNYNKFLREKQKDSKEQTLGDILGMNKYIDLKTKKKYVNKNRKINSDELNHIIYKFTNNLTQNRILKKESKFLPGIEETSVIQNEASLGEANEKDKCPPLRPLQRNDNTRINSFNKYFTFHDNISYVQDSILKNNSILLKDSNIEISINQQYYGTNGILKIFLKNKKLVNYYDMDIQISNKILFPLKFKFLSYENMLCANAVNCYEMAVKCVHMYKGFPLIKISYRMQDMFRKSIELRLPIPINKFMKNIKITKDVFVKFWNNENFNIYKKEKIINKIDTLDKEKILLFSSLGNALSVCYIEDMIYLTGCYADNSNALENYFVLVGIEIIKNKLKIICKSNNPTLSSAILFLIVLILKKHKR
ncbi:hypothetical protein, conserved [Plasmodium gonderi]|uniref:Clathrin adaptor domain-containing protein n=1 Tax=Plasmodium gonderi TaxID=77519 RepID=A0A1Y1JML7_PLAGO|nr:hypothetical protein, conserved [Plasmodium gonderi]GAW83826.1 hypothetical protein, conserved [Plasmodium gonderi]